MKLPACILYLVSLTFLACSAEGPRSTGNPKSTKIISLANLDCLSEPRILKFARNTGGEFGPTDTRILVAGKPGQSFPDSLTLDGETDSIQITPAQADSLGVRHIASTMKQSGSLAIIGQKLSAAHFQTIFFQEGRAVLSNGVVVLDFFSR